MYSTSYIVYWQTVCNLFLHLRLRISNNGYIFEWLLMQEFWNADKYYIYIHFGINNFHFVCSCLFVRLCLCSYMRLSVSEIMWYLFVFWTVFSSNPRQKSRQLVYVKSFILYKTFIFAVFAISSVRETKCVFGWR